MPSKKWKQLMEHGRELLEKRDIPGAEHAFASALALEEDVSARNNLALAVFLQGEAERALDVLEPNLDPRQSFGNPFSFSLAALILAALGRRKEGRRYLDLAISLFDRGRKLLEQMDLDKNAWYEYTVVIMKGAGALGEHRLVLDLYKRWESCHITWENRFLAGVASFNLGRYRRAASLWGSLADIGPFALHMQQVAFLVERGLIPSFPLEYEQTDPETLQQAATKAPPKEQDALLSLYAGNGTVRMQLLSYLFGAKIEDDEAEKIVIPLIRYGGDWGKAFGLRLLEAGGVPQGFKFSAAVALVQRGVFKAGEPIPVIIDGKEETMKIEQRHFSLEPDPELDRLNDEARKLRDRGRFEDAVVLLEPLYEQGRYYPATMLTLANLYRTLNRLDHARKVLEMLEAMLPEHPVVLFNLAALCLERGDYRRSLQYLDRLDEAGPNKDISGKAGYLRRKAELHLAMADPEARRALELAYEDEAREDIEQKVLPLKASLRRGLKNMPSDWLEYICAVYGLERCRLRREREELIVSTLGREATLRKAVAALDESGRELLRYLLARGGWARLQAVTRKFGTMQGDGCSWLEAEPASLPGRLWSRALIMVGRAGLENRSARVVLIPADLREKLARILGVKPPGVR